MKVGTSKIKELTGYSIAHIIRLAKAGKIPGAYQADDGCELRFDWELVKKWWKSKEISQCQYISAEASFGYDSSSEGEKSVSQHILGLKQKRKNLRQSNVLNMAELRVAINRV